jgi:hypothetical protein
MGTQQAPTGPGTVPDEVLADLLDSERRCRLLEQLSAASEAAVVEDLAAAVCAAEEGCSPTEVSETRRRAVQNELFEEHIPKLVATGIVRYDSMVGRLWLEEPGVAVRAERSLSEYSKDK